MDPVAGFYAAYDRHDASLLQGLFALDYRGTVNGRPVASAAEGQAFVAGFLAAFPDCRFTLHDRMDSGGKTAVRWSFTGTHLGTFAGLPATGKAASADGMTWFDVDAGRIRRLWSQWDAAGLLSRLGAP